MNWSADFQIGALEKPGMIAPIWKSALRCAFRGPMREIFRGNLFPLRGEGGRKCPAVLIAPDCALLDKVLGFRVNWP